MPRPSIETTRGWRDKTMVGHEGAPLGRITHIYWKRSPGSPSGPWSPPGSSGSSCRWSTPPNSRTRSATPSSGCWSPTPQSSGPVGGCPGGHRPAARLLRRRPELRWGSARRMPRGGPAARLRRGLVWTRERVPSPAAGGSRRTRLLLAAGAAVSSLAGGLLLARRRRRERPSGLAGAIGGAVGSVLAVPAGALRRRRLRALAGTAAAPLAAAGRAVARASRRGRHRPGRRNRERRGTGGHAWQAT
jgi:LPXTG-motif cell wall-anchored protein